MTLEKVKEIKEVYEKIIDHYGISPYQSSYVPDLVLYSDVNCGLCGFMCNDQEEIGINFAMHTTTREIISTMIHEYMHYHQHPGWYTRYFKTHKYNDHPYEIQANEIADRDVHLFTDKKR